MISIPILKGKTKAAISQNIKMLMKEGRSQDQSVAIALENARRTGKPKVDKKQLAMGIKVEFEHTNNPKIAEKIALVHLREFPGFPYYTELAKLEKKAKKEVKSRWKK